MFLNLVVGLGCATGNFGKVFFWYSIDFVKVFLFLPLIRAVVDNTVVSVVSAANILNGTCIN